MNTFDRVRTDIQARLKDLAGPAQEYLRLQAALEALDKVIGPLEPELEPEPKVGQVTIPSPRRRQRRPVSAERVRDVGIELGQFSVAGLARRLDASRAAVDKHVKTLAERGTFVRLKDSKGPGSLWGVPKDEHPELRNVESNGNDREPGWKASAASAVAHTGRPVGPADRAKRTQRMQASGRPMRRMKT